VTDDGRTDGQTVSPGINYVPVDQYPVCSFDIYLINPLTPAVIAIPDVWQTTVFFLMFSY